MDLPKICQSVYNADKVDVFSISGKDSSIMALIEGDRWTQDLLCAVMHDTRAVPSRCNMSGLQPAVLEFEALFNDLMNVRAHFNDVISLSPVAQLMHTQQQAVIINIQPLKQMSIVLYLLEQGFLDLKVHADLLMGVSKI